MKLESHGIIWLKVSVKLGFKKKAYTINSDTNSYGFCCFCRVLERKKTTGHVAEVELDKIVTE